MNVSMLSTCLSLMPSNKIVYRNASHHSLRHWWQSPCCLEFAPHVWFNQSLKRSSFFFNTKNCPSTTYALSNPFSANFPPNTGPMPANSVTGLSPIGSETKFRCFCEVLITASARICWVKKASKKRLVKLHKITWFGSDTHVVLLLRETGRVVSTILKFPKHFDKWLNWSQLPWITICWGGRTFGYVQSYQKETCSSRSTWGFGDPQR